MAYSACSDNLNVLADSPFVCFSLIDRRGTVVVDMNNQVSQHSVANGYASSTLTPTVMYRTELVTSSGQKT